MQLKIDTNKEWRKQCIDFVRKIGEKPEGLYVLTLGKPTRTPPQNRRYWKCIIECFSNFTGYEKTETHQILSKKFLSYEKKGKGDTVHLFVKSTTQLTTKEFCEYNEQCERFGAEYGIIFPSDREY